LIRHGELFKFLLARVLESVSVDGHR
jgi:hypothetical protein